MKKRIIVRLIPFVSLTISLTTLCSEKNWFKSTVSNYAKNMINSHTYRHMSPQQIRDGFGLLCLPSNISLYILYKQRENMIKFLHDNETAAKEKIRKHYNIDPTEWSAMEKESKEDHAFNLNEMKHGTNFNTQHDDNLPIEWHTALDNGCNHYTINPKSINRLITTDEKHFANAQENLPTNYLEKNYKTYNPATIRLNICFANQHWYYNRLQETAYHEITHVAQGHSVQILHIFNILKRNNQNLLDVEHSEPWKQFRAAQEKTADTLIPCTNSNSAHNTAWLIKHNGLRGVYPDNHNDMLVIATNWLLTQAIEKKKGISDLYKKRTKIVQRHQQTHDFLISIPITKKTHTLNIN